MPFELHIALRYLLARRKQAFISVISLISTLGVAVGVTALIIALALMTGLQGELRDRILGSARTSTCGSATALAWTIARRSPSCARWTAWSAPRRRFWARRCCDRARRAFVTLKGIDPELEPEVTDLGRAMTAGRVGDLEPRSRGRRARHPDRRRPRQDLGMAVGDSVTLLTPEGTLSPMGMMPRARRLSVAGVFRLGLYDSTPPAGLSRSSGRAAVQYAARPVELKVRDIYAAPEIAHRLRDAGQDYIDAGLGGHEPSLFSALWLEKMAISITIGLIVIVAALNIIASLVLLVMEKSRDIAILKTMGASCRSVTTVFMLQGLIIGLVGTAAARAWG